MRTAWWSVHDRGRPTPLSQSGNSHSARSITVAAARTLNPPFSCSADLRKAHSSREGPITPADTPKPSPTAEHETVNKGSDAYYVGRQCATGSSVLGSRNSNRHHLKRV